MTWPRASGLLGVAALLYIAGDAITALQFTLFAGTVVLPGAALFMKACRLSELPPTIRLVVAALATVLAATPVYAIRQAGALPAVWFDVLLGGACLGAAWRTGSLGEARRTFEESVIPECSIYLTLAIPALLAFTWAGFGATGDGLVRFYGLLAMDFGNLTSIVSVLRASTGLPSAQVAGAGVLHYHWLYFSLPAWNAGFLGQATRSATSLMLCNYLAAAALFVTLADTVRRSMGSTSRVAAFGAFVGVFAPSAMYAYQFGLRFVDPSWFTGGLRNHLLLMPASSMTAAGNNVLAITAVLCLIHSLEAWRAVKRLRYAALSTLLLAALAGYSVTLVVPASVMVIGLWLWRYLPTTAGALALAFGLALASGAILFRIELFTGSGVTPALAFDRGQFVLHALFGLSPLVLLAGFSGGRSRLMLPLGLLIVGLIATPSFLVMRGSPMGNLVFSLKIGTLLACALTPFACAGFTRLTSQARVLGRVVAWSLVAVGLVHTSAFALQHVFYRVAGRPGRATTFDLDYVRALDVIRGGTEPAAVVLDPLSLPLDNTLPSLLIAERRAWLPNVYVRTTTALGESIASRPIVWRRWAANGCRADEDSRFLSQATDAAVTTVPLPPEDWRLEARFGRYLAYRSRRSGLWRRSIGPGDALGRRDRAPVPAEP